MSGEPNQEFRSGFVGLAGAPNAGKSTLVNRLVGQEVSIVSPRPQTTRHRICGILNEASYQLVLVDVPGITSAPDAFNRNLLASAETALRGCDAIVHLRSPDTRGRLEEGRVISLLTSIAKPTLEVWNKSDLGPKPAGDAPPALSYVGSYAISARSGAGLAGLKRALVERLPLGPPLYPADDLCDRDLRFLAAEIVREKLFLHLHHEVPYALATWTEDWEGRPGGPIHLLVIIQTERAAHKPILIGAGGAMLKKIGIEARPEIERLIGAPVYLELRVRVRPHWRTDAAELERLGMRLVARGG